MNRAPLFVLALLLSATPVLAQLDYHYSLSASSTDPFVNVAAPATILEVWLWLYETCDDGVAALEFDVVAAGDLVNLGFFPADDVLNAGNDTWILLAVGGCPSAPFPLGSFVTLDPSGFGGTLCIVPSAANGWSVSVDCDTINPVVHDNGSYGFASDGSLPCGELSFCPLGVENRSWGRVKGLFR